MSPFHSVSSHGAFGYHSYRVQSCLFQITEGKFFKIRLATQEENTVWGALFYIALMCQFLYDSNQSKETLVATLEVKSLGEMGGT